jgi:hypothetical protein
MNAGGSGEPIPTIVLPLQEMMQRLDRCMVPNVAAARDDAGDRCMVPLQEIDVWFQTPQEIDVWFHYKR